MAKARGIRVKHLESESYKDAEEKLATNRVNLGLSCTEVRARQDDLWAKLHDSRFLAGAGCLATRMLLTARESISLNGHPAISMYDMQAVGLAGFVTASSWCEIAKPFSAKLSVKMFNMNTCAAWAPSSCSKQEDDDLADFTEVGEFIVELRAMRSAMAFLVPWNMSMAALEGFLINTTSILTSFADYVPSENANRWRSQNVRDPQAVDAEGPLQEAVPGFLLRLEPWAVYKNNRGIFLQDGHAAQARVRLQGRPQRATESLQ
jgi:hypothetical protein